MEIQRLKTTRRALVARDKAAKVTLGVMVASNLLAASSPTLVSLLGPLLPPAEYLVLAAFAIVALLSGPFNQGLDSSLLPAACLSCATVAASVVIARNYPLPEVVRLGAVAYAIVQAGLLCVAGAFATLGVARR